MSTVRSLPGSGPNVSPEDLITLLAVARLGTYSAAAHTLGVNHTTVSRRITALEKAVGDYLVTTSPEGWELTARGRELLPVAEEIEAALARVQSPRGDYISGTIRVATPEGFALQWGIPALAGLQAKHHNLQIELVTATQRVRQYRSGVDVEIAVGRPEAPRSRLYPVHDYHLGLFCTPEYLRTHPPLDTIDDVAGHRLIYYIEHALQVDDLDSAEAALPRPAGFLRSNSVIAHVQAACSGAGVGLLPDFLAEARAELVRVLPEFHHRVSYWAAVRQESLRNPGVWAVLEAFGVKL